MFPVSDPRFTRKRSNEPARHIFGLSRICRFWRDVTFFHPLFWSRIESPKPESEGEWNLINTCLARSRDAYLHVSDINFTMWNAIGDHSRRLRYYSLNFSKDSSPTSITRYSVPNLERLLLDNNGRTNIGHIEQISSLFEPEMPGLRRLYLRGFTSWANLQFSHLTHLALCKHSHPSVHMDQFHDLLRDCPFMEVLILENWYPRGEESSDRSRSPIVLGVLRRLVMEQATMQTITTFMSHLNFPPTTAIRMSVRTPPGNELLPLIIPYGVFDCAPFTESRCISITLLPHWDKASLAFFALDETHKSGFASTVRNITRPTECTSLCLKAALPMINLSRIQELSLDLGLLPDIVNWKAMFELMPYIRVLSVIDRHLPNCIGHLRDGLLPSLEVLRLMQTLEWAVDPLPPPQAQNHVFGSRAALEELVSQRERDGRRLKEIHVRQWSITPLDLGEIRQHVDDLFVSSPLPRHARYTSELPFTLSDPWIREWDA